MDTKQERINRLEASLKQAFPTSLNSWRDANSFTLDFQRDSVLTSDIREWQREHQKEIERVEINHIGGSTYVRVIVADGEFSTSRPLLKRYYVAPAAPDSNSYNVLEYNRKNAWDEPWVEVAQVTYEEALQRCAELNAHLAPEKPARHELTSANILLDKIDEVHNILSDLAALFHIHGLGGDFQAHYRNFEIAEWLAALQGEAISLNPDANTSIGPGAHVRIVGGPLASEGHTGIVIELVGEDHCMVKIDFTSITVCMDSCHLLPIVPDGSWNCGNID